MGALSTKSLTELQDRFLSRMADTGDCRASALHADCSVEHGYALLRMPHIAAELQNRVRRKIVASAPLALKVIVDLVRSEDISPKVRLDAAKILLERAGHVAPRAAIEKPADAPLHEMSTDQLRELAGRLEDEIAGRAKTVSSAELAPPDDQAFDVVG